MAGTFNRELALVVDAQSVEGTPNPTIAALTGPTIALSDGLVLGDSGSGILKSGIDISLARVEKDPGFVSGSFTRLDGDFIEAAVDLTFSFPMAGPRITTTTPVDTEFEHDVGIDALFACCGLDGASGGSTWFYTPADATFATVKIFDSGNYWVIRDVKGDITFNLPAGEVGIATCTLKGVVDSFGATTFPATVDYGVQATVNAPVVAGVVPSWGISAEERGWETLSISIVNDLQDYADSAKTPARIVEQNGREITVEIEIIDTDTDIDFSYQNLIGTTAPTDDLIGTMGFDDIATGADPAVAYTVSANNLRVQDYTPGTRGVKAKSTITAVCTGTTAGSEFFIEFK